ncbi:MAG: hypothetical protein K0S47_2240 [Herbinix sp.]|jgi:hypothetical protein|nr:hypothetical protein [Herbinix sp.]
MKNKFTLYLLHASHTDIGYTDTQEKMKEHHIAFIREVLQIIEKEPRFKWNCESYWCVEQFLNVATEDEKQAFIDAVHQGNIGLSGSYLNLTDLVPEYVHTGIMNHCNIVRESLSVKAESAVTADINGYSWGFADVLYDQGVKHLMSNIHTHHGYHPLFRKQTPFWWESPKGNKILVWNGEHYNLGNELGIAQEPSFEYTIQDGLTHKLLSPYEKAVARIRAYVDTICEQGYEYSFVPIGLSGGMTDNAPPSLKILDFIDRYNAENTEIELKMSTLDEFFAAVKEEGKDIPTYSGDWTDWWADGIGSTPADVIQYRNAARSFHIAEKMDPTHQLAPEEEYYKALYNLMFYGEHTWGYSSSISEPYHPQVNNLDQWKRLYALKASESATIIREKIQIHHGETAISYHKQLKFRAINPHNIPVQDMLVIDIEQFYGYHNFIVVDENSGEKVPFQIGSYSRGPQMCIWLCLQPHETKTFVLQELPKNKLASAGLCAPTGIEGVNDLYWRVKRDLEQGDCVTVQGIENVFYSIRFEPKKGIVSIFDKSRNVELIAADRPYAAFTPIYEVTPRDLGEEYMAVRRNMGRNRKAFRTRRSVGELYDVKVMENGALYSRVKLSYQLDGLQECSIILTAYKRMPKLDVDVRMHKDSVWEPENVYLSLPFTGKETYIDKSGAILRPRMDQLPGTCTDFYAIQNGVVFADGEHQTIVTCPDAPLITMGSLEAHPIRLMGEDVINNDEVYSWMMNNFWETNFKASLGGFYQFHYELALEQHNKINDAFATAEAMNEGVLQFYLFEGNRSQI